MSVVAKQAVVSGDEAVMAAVPVFQSTDTLADRQERAPNHDAVPAAVALRKIIAATPAGARQLMSASLMVELLVAKEGLPEPMASRLFSQIRKGAPLYDEWKAAFACERFIQRPSDVAPKTVSAPELPCENVKRAFNPASEAPELPEPSMVPPGLPTEAESAEALLALLRGPPAVGGASGHRRAASLPAGSAGGWRPAAPGHRRAATLHRSGPPSGDSDPSAEPPAPKAAESHPRNASSFVTHLYAMMADPSRAHVCGFCPDGASFYVTHANEFPETVLPQYFKHNRMRSFLRQLNQYSFAKRHCEDATTYTHPRFVRGRRDLLNQVKRRAPGEPAATAETLGGEAPDLEDDQERAPAAAARAAKAKAPNPGSGAAPLASGGKKQFARVAPSSELLRGAVLPQPQQQPHQPPHQPPHQQEPHFQPPREAAGPDATAAPASLAGASCVAGVGGAEAELEQGRRAGHAAAAGAAAAGALLPPPQLYYARLHQWRSPSSGPEMPIVGARGGGGLLGHALEEAPGAVDLPISPLGRAVSDASAAAAQEAAEVLGSLGGLNYAAAAEAGAAASRIIDGFPSTSAAVLGDGETYRLAQRRQNVLRVPEMVSPHEFDSSQRDKMMQPGANGSDIFEEEEAASLLSYIARSHAKKRKLETNEVDLPSSAKRKIVSKPLRAASPSKASSRNPEPYPALSFACSSSSSSSRLTVPAMRLNEMPRYKNRPLGKTGHRFILKHEFVTKSGALFSGYSLQVPKAFFGVSSFKHKNFQHTLAKRNQLLNDWASANTTLPPKAICDWIAALDVDGSG